ncbi:hypothetical protein [Candidatus Nitrospira bockiana]
MGIVVVSLMTTAMTVAWLAVDVEAFEFRLDGLARIPQPMPVSVPPSGLLGIEAGSRPFSASLPPAESGTAITDKAEFALAVGKAPAKEDDGGRDEDRLAFAGQSPAPRSSLPLMRQDATSSFGCPLCRAVTVGPVISVPLRDVKALLITRTAGEHVGSSLGSSSARRAIPIPGSLILFAAGFAGLAAWHRKRS